MTKTSKLTDLDLVLLSSAAQRDDGMLLPPPETARARGKTLERTLTKLLRLGLVEECEAEAPNQTWRRDDDDRGIALRIADVGRDALGIDANTDPAVGAEDEAPKSGTTTSAAASEAGTTRDEREPATATVPITPGIKPGTKQARLVDCLNGPAGARIDDLVRTLGWQAHTVRAALTGLRKKGYLITSTKGEDGATVYRATPPTEVADDAA